MKFPLYLTLIPALLLAPTAFAENAPKPFDHGDDPNVELFEYKELKTVPETPPTRQLAPLELPDKIYHGVLLNTDSQELFDKRYAKYLAVTDGVKPSMIGCFHARWGNGVEWPAEMLLDRLRVLDTRPGVIPFVRYYTGDWKPGGPFLKADDILAGKEDDYFRKLAQASKDFGKPFLLSINHEMNGDWFFFSEGYKKGETDWTPAKYIEVWRHIHRLFRAEGADKVAFAWTPAANGRAKGKYDSRNSYKLYYPGDEFVDWVGASVYNDVNPYALDNLAATYPNKPIILAEWGTEPHRGQWYVPKPYPGDAAWMKSTLEFVLHRYPNMKAITWFYWGPDSDIERVPEQVPVYQAAIKDARMLSNP